MRANEFTTRRFRCSDRCSIRQSVKSSFDVPARLTLRPVCVKQKYRAPAPRSPAMGRPILLGHSLSVSSAGLVGNRTNRLRRETQSFANTFWVHPSSAQLPAALVYTSARSRGRSTAGNPGRNESVFQKIFNFTFTTESVRVDFGTVLDPSRFPRFPGLPRLTYGVLRFVPRRGWTTKCVIKMYIATSHRCSFLFPSA